MSKEIKAGLIALSAIVVLILGINFLKGRSLFGGDNLYYSYFPNSGQLMVSSNVTLNGVTIGKVVSIENVPTNPEKKRVKINFSIQESNISLPKGTVVEVGNLDLLTKGLMIIYPNKSKTNSNYLVGSEIPGRLSVDMFSQVKQYADPISQKLQTLMISIDKMVSSLSGVWSEGGSSEIVNSIKEVRLTIKKIGTLAEEIESFVGEEKNQFTKVMDNVEGITSNLKKSSDQITAIIGNAKGVTDDLVTADFKGTILEAQTTLKKFNMALDDVNNGNGSIGKLLKDEKLYNELVATNKEVQNLVIDLKKHPERYVHFSLVDRKNKKSNQLLDTIQD